MVVASIITFIAGQWLIDLISRSMFDPTTIFLFDSGFWQNLVLSGLILAVSIYLPSRIAPNQFWGSMIILVIHTLLHVIVIASIGDMMGWYTRTMAGQVSMLVLTIAVCFSMARYED